MSVRIMAAVWDIDLPASDKIVLLALADNANDHGVCWPSIPTIARKASKSERTVYESLARLETAGHLTRDNTAGKSTRYNLHPCENRTLPLRNPQATPAKFAPKPS